MLKIAAAALGCLSTPVVWGSVRDITAIFKNLA